MASQLNRDEVAHIANLAQIDMTASELDTFARQLTDILAYAATIQQADTSGIETDASANAANLPEPRPDTPIPSLDRDAALAIAPDGRPAAGLFRVPKVL
jgi:aspartyl-tRNA(Asn)/glutamyl-tRNA(Gln) amidotransferase subunit C